MNRKHKKLKGFSESPFLFIVNPNSGTGLAKSFLDIVESYSDQANISVEISKSGEHSIELAKTAASKGFKFVVAVGGDGSVHEIGLQLVNQLPALGIIPTGSGNGVSRHLGISNNIEEALVEILQGKTRSIDIIKANSELAIGFCGLGIDAHVASVFATSKERGFYNYIRLTIDAFNSYVPTPIEVITEDYHQIHEAFSVVVANTTQLGNNAYINPKGIDDDGFLECVIVKKFPPLAFTELSSRLFLKSLDKSKHVEIIKAKKITINNLGLAPFQIDGETLKTANSFTFEALPKALNVIVP